MKKFSNMLFSVNLFTALCVLLGSLLPLSVNAGSVKLNTRVEVEENFVTLGDIFSNVSHGEEHVISQAPELGKVLQFNYKTLRRIAQSFKLDWEPQSQFVQTTIRRASTQISLDEVKATILEELMRRESIQHREGISWTVQLRKSPSVFHVPAQSLPKIQFADLRFEPKSSRFQADVELYAGGALQRIRGEFFATIAIPVPLHSIARDETISRRDLHFVHMRKDKVSPNVQTDINKVIGKSPRRILRADAAIPIQYLQEPVLVKRQRMVSVVYSVKNLILTTKGMAMSDGSLGQVVQVKNLKSSRIIDSVVTGSDEVSVSFAGSADL